MLELNYGDNYLKVDANPRVLGSLKGEIFAGSWEMLEDCFGITSDTIEDWCKFNGYHYSVKKYTPKDKLLDSLYNLRGKTKDPSTAEGLSVIIDEVIANYEKETEQ